MAPVIFDDASRTWLLTTSASSYVLRLDDEVPRHVHWGRPLPIEAARSLAFPVAPFVASFDGVCEDAELTVEGGAVFGVPSLTVRYGDGSAGVEWRYVSHSVDGERLAIELADRRHPLSIILHYRVVPDCDVIERWVVLRHHGSAGPIELRRCDSAHFVLPRLPGYRVSHVSGGWSREFQLERVVPAVGETVFTSRRGTTSHQANPWLMVDAGEATEDSGEVWSAALAWSGSWRITVQHSPAGRLSWTGGFGHDGTSWRLRPGEEWTTPVFAGLYCASGFGGTSRRWHEYTRTRVLPAAGELRPILYNSWEATGFDISEESQRRLAGIAADLGVEVFVMDDGWFGARRADNAGLGDWHPAPSLFPNGLSGLVDEVHRLGMRFGLWVEPEMVNPDSDLYRAHPEWVLHQPGRRRTELRNQLVLNFARPDVAAWAHAWLDALVSDNGIDFLKWDMNRAFTEAGWPDSDDPDRLWIDHVRAVYSIMDRLRADHPGLRIESCSGGGGRADLGILARTDQVWTSDNTDPVDRLAIQHGYGQLYPARTMAAWVTDNPGHFTGRSTPLAFRFHVAMAGVLGIGVDLLRWDADELTEARALLQRYKEIRPTVHNGSMYRLSTPDGYVTGVEYVGDDVVVLVWRPFTRYELPAPVLRLRGLDPGARYRDEAGETHLGAALMARGLTVSLPAGDYASTCVRLETAQPARPAVLP
jgi:alpha-galactosidase